MITIFNRRELTLTHEMTRQSEIQSLLAQNGIAYIIKTRGQADAFFRSSGRAGFGSARLNPAFQYSYTFYVHKCDYEKAAFLITQK